MWCLIVSIPELCPLSYFYTVGGANGISIAMRMESVSYSAILCIAWVYSGVYGYLWYAKSSSLGVFDGHKSDSKTLYASMWFENS